MKVCLKKSKAKSLRPETQVDKHFILLCNWSHFIVDPDEQRSNLRGIVKKDNTKIIKPSMGVFNKPKQEFGLL